MKKSVKTLALITILSTLTATFSFAQLKLPAINPVTNDVKKVLEDHANHFANIKGEVLSRSTQTTEYACIFNANGAEQTTITQYSSSKEMYSWQATMLSTESFEKARQKFKALFHQLNNLSIKTKEGNYKFKGDYTAPDNNKKFNTIVLSDDEGALKIEVTMEVYEQMEWRVKLIIYDREREDNEKGKENDQ